MVKNIKSLKYGFITAMLKDRSRSCGWILNNHKRNVVQFRLIEIVLDYIETIPLKYAIELIDVFRDYVYVETDSFILFDRSMGRLRRPLLAVQAS